MARGIHFAANRFIEPLLPLQTVGLSARRPTTGARVDRRDKQKGGDLSTAALQPPNYPINDWLTD
jgi:hypothetical protein